MACYINENVYTHTFTPREYQVELLDSAKKRNTIICSSTGSAKAFIIIKLLQEFSYEMRKDNGKQALFLLDVKNVPVMTSHVKLLTDLTVISIINNPLDIDNDPNVGNDHDNALSLREFNVIITTAEICVSMCRRSLIDLMNNYNLIVIDCLYGYKEYKYIEEIMSIYQSVNIEKPPRILGLTSGILSNDMKPERLEAELQRLEKLLNSHVDTSSEILTLIRLSCRPRERIIECAKNIPSSLHERLKYLIRQAKDFLCDHRYDLSEIYDDDLLKEFKQLPDPKEQPLNLFDEFLEILEDLGPWAADRVAYGMLIKIEKLKVKVPYERHYLLLCMTSTVFVTIRAECDNEFQNLTDKERIFNFSTPKVLRFLEVIKQFKPAINKPEMTEKISDNSRYKNLDISNNNNNNNTNTNKKFKGKNFKNHRRTPYMIRNQTDDLLCALVFVKNRYKAEALFTLLCIMSKNDEEYWWVSVSFTVNKIADPVREPKEAESEHKRQEEVLRKYRSHECNIMIATAALEQGCDLPKCNLVIRFDLPQSFQSYIYSKARARANESHYLLFVNEDQITKFVNILATYNEVENTLLKRCYSLEPDKNEEFQADSFSVLCKPYRPLSDNGNYVTLSNAIALINRYCAKLPSDTFTRLTPIWYETKTDNGYICTISLPINSPVKKQITSPPMMNMLLARRAAAFILCQLLHKAGELDDNLQPISKENFKTNDEYDWNISLLDNDDNDDEDDNSNIVNNNNNNNDDYIKNQNCVDNDIDENLEPRPGTTKRRQYYYKKIADALLNCHPISNEPVYFYKIVMKLTCPLPEEQNTRGRKIYPPEESPQGFGILTSKEIPKISAFPIFTRSGEVSVELELCSKIVLNVLQILKIREFVNYTFTSVLRLQKYLTLFNPDASANSYLIVPTIEDSSNNQMLIDWDFIDLIFDNLNVLPEIVPEQVRKNYTFDIEKYRDAVVMPWYRNQDQPQYFYVAEICTNLNPSSDFPGSDYATFEEYYYKKYNIRIQNKEQYLLDVDHTSARLNFLTPRYVNRKGVALPTSSEATKRAKREKLEQKQILVPELCAIHPFTASLWRKAVCLPCILYRINALLLADQIRRTVAIELKLGKLELDPDFKWPPLNFGWSLADVLKKSKEEKKIEKKIDQIDEHDNKTSNDDAEKLKNNNKEETNNIIDDSEMIEIGTWSNDMATLNNNDNNNEYTVIRYASPTNWLNINNSHDNIDDGDDDDDDDDDDNNNNNHNHNNTDDEIDIVDDDVLFSDLTCSDDESDLEWGGLRIEFTGDNIAEALDDDQQNDDDFKLVDYSNLWRIDDDDGDDYNKDDDTFNNKHDDGSDVVGGSADDDKNLSEKLKNEFLYNCQKNYQHILSSGILVKKSECFIKYTENDTYFNRELDMISTNFDFNQLFIDTNINELLSNSKNNTNFHNNNNNNNNINIIGDNDVDDGIVFKFDQQPDLDQHPGPSPNVLLQALTMSNANDGINLERLETIGDSFLKYAITNYLYSKYENVHEGKLSHLRSKQVSNLNLYRLGKKKGLGEFMIATKFDPHDNWLPPCFYVPKELEEALIDAHFPANCWTISDMAATRDMSIDEICTMVRERGDINLSATVATATSTTTTTTLNNTIPYNLVTQHSIPDKSIADCVEALIGAYLIECGPRGALLFMAWLGINVLPKLDNGAYGQVKLPKSPLACNCDYGRNKDDGGGDDDDDDNNDNSDNNLINIRLNILLDGYDKFEMHIGYKFRDRSYLLQALTHASYTPNTLTDCYQRLEFLGDAVLDYLITRHLYEDKRMHSPGALTDLRSALVNNTIFASLAVRNGFHRYFRNLSPTLNEVIEKFVRLQEDNGHTLVDELYLVVDVETDEVEDVEVPKALGDVFESVAGAIFLDSGMSLDAVWKVYYNMMKNEIEQFSNKVPKSPIRELLELEPETAKFGKPEKLADGRRVRVTVEVFGKGVFKGIGRNYRIAKCTAAKCALKNLKKRGLIKKSDDK